MAHVGLDKGADTGGFAKIGQEYESGKPKQHDSRERLHGLLFDFEFEW